MTRNTSEIASRYRWRVVDIVVAAVLAVATGLIFLMWNIVGGAGLEIVGALTPGLGGLVVGIWLLGGILGGLIIRKPGAAIAVELLAACFSAALGSQWGISTIYSGLAQGLGAELIFALFCYKRWNLPIAMFAGAGAGAGAWILEFIMGNAAKSFSFNAVYVITLLISGAVLAGVLGWYLVKALASTGVLDRFEAGREARRHGV
ncbi:MAG: ECF transporter S component [Propionibacteriaceae bacterium]